MIEAYAHNHIKDLLKKDSFIWPHNLTLSRLVSRSLRRKDKSLIQLEIGDQDSCWLGLLIPLCLHSKGVVLLLTDRQRRHLHKFELPRLKSEGLYLPIWEGNDPPQEEHVWVLDYSKFFEAYRKGYLHHKQLIIPEVDLFSSRMREAMSIEVTSSHWDSLRIAHPSVETALIDLHDRLTRRLFLQATRVNAQVQMDSREVFALKDLLRLLGQSPMPWPDVLNIDSQSWASWAELDHQSFDWNWHLKPLEPMHNIQELFRDNPFILLSGASENQFFLNNLEILSGSLNVKVRLGNTSFQEPIKLFTPHRQPLPNTEYFSEYLLNQCRRLILGRSGLTIIVLDDDLLLRKLTSALAAEFGKRVIYESTAPQSNGVICCSSTWWINSSGEVPAPEQLIIAILPFPRLESPLIAARVEAFKSQKLDWFRDLLLQELLEMLPRLVYPVRKSNGRIAILDGRMRSRSWGKKVFRGLEPWVPLDRLLPD